MIDLNNKFAMCRMNVIIEETKITKLKALLKNK